MNWRTIYQTYDDEALATLANPGLVRRAAKDVAADKVDWQTQSADGATLLADGQQVQLDGRGPGKAQCDCPAPGLCKHILAAVMWVRAQSTGPDSAGPPQHEARPEPAAELPAAPERQASAAPSQTEAGKTDKAKTGQTSEAGTTNQPGTASAPATTASARPAPPSQARAANQLTPAIPATKAGKVTITATLGPGEQLLIKQIDDMLADLLKLGLAHVSPLAAQRWQSLNMSARAEGMPRLAALLRDLAGTIRQLAAHDASSNSEAALAQMAHLHAFCHSTALGTAKPAEELIDALDLLPVGAWWWQSLGGARGLSLALWDAQQGRLLHAVQARANALDTTFSREKAWALHPLWRGASSVQQLCQGAVRLQQARLTGDAGLALGGNTLAESLPGWRSDDARLAQLGHANWQALRAQLAQAQGLHGQLPPSILLRPTACSEPKLDEIAQQLNWDLSDAHGQTLRLQLPCADQAAIQALDHYWAPTPLAVLARVERRGFALALCPLALLQDDGGALRLINLGFASVKPKKTSPLLGRILRLLQKKKDLAPDASASNTPMRHLLDPVLIILESMAATGRLHLDPVRRNTLQQQLALCAAYGLSSLQAPLKTLLENDPVEPQQLLRLHYLLGRLLMLESC